MRKPGSPTASTEGCEGTRDWTQGCVCRVLYADIGAPGQFRKIMACDQARSSFEKNFAATLCANLPSLFSLPSLSFSFEYFLAMEATSLYFRNNCSNHIFVKDLDQSFEKEKGTFEYLFEFDEKKTICNSFLLSRISYAHFEKLLNDQQ